MLTKFVALVLLPFLLWKRPSRKQFQWLALFCLVVFAAYLPFYEPGISVLAALNTYAVKWQFNASIFAVVSRVVIAVHPSDNLDANLLIAKYILGFCYVLLFATRLYRWSRMPDRDSATLIREWLILFGALVLITPTLHPWYLLWLLPALVLWPHRAWLLLTGTVVLSYWVLQRYYEQGVWQEEAWVQLAVYVPFYALLLYDWLRWPFAAWFGRHNGAQRVR